MSGGNPVRVVVWAALCAGPVAYAGLLLSGVLPPLAADPPQAVPVALGAAAFAAVVLSRVLWTRLVAGGEERAGRGGAGPAAGADPVLTRAIVVWALDESVALFGFVLALLGGPPLLPVPFFAVSLLLLAMDHPGRLG